MEKSLMAFVTKRGYVILGPPTPSHIHHNTRMIEFSEKKKKN
jgi:hypothetical protein